MAPFLALGVCGAFVARQSRAVANLKFSAMVGEMCTGPEYQAVPMGIASQVTAGFVSNCTVMLDLIPC